MICRCDCIGQEPGGHDQAESKACCVVTLLLNCQLLFVALLAIIELLLSIRVGAGAVEMMEREICFLLLV